MEDVVVTDHCRGTLVVHALPDAECTDPNCVDCEAPDHTLVIHCTDVDGGCPVCAPPRLHSFAA